MENIDKDDLIIVNPPICEEEGKYMDWIDMHMFVYGAKGSGKNYMLKYYISNLI